MSYVDVNVDVAGEREARAAFPTLDWGVLVERRMDGSIAVYLVGQDQDDATALLEAALHELRARSWNARLSRWTGRSG